MTRLGPDGRPREVEATRVAGGDELGPAPSAVVTAAPQLFAGRYEILGLLGAGGMGAVYRARDTELDELVALKTIRSELGTDPGVLARFRQEAKLARRVTHRNVARTFDIGEHDGARFLTMELVDGESLASRLEGRGRLQLVEAVSILQEICDAVSAAHAAGVVHRDLKPDNVLLGAGGRVVVTDFGIARALAAGDASRTAGAVLGTPIYMAPEQVEGARDIDGRADIYALGAMMFELFTGAPPWTGDTPLAVAAARLVRPPPDPRDLRPELPSRLADVVVRCMARDRAARFTTAEEVSLALAEMAASTSIVAASASAPVSRLPPPRVEGVGDKTVAVLPFRNGGAPDDAYLADGLTDDLIDVLSMTRGLRVRPRGALAHLASGDRDPREVGRKLDVAVVVQGSVRRCEAGVRVSAQLIGVADGFQLWAKRFERPANQAFGINDEAAQAIAEALTVHFTAKLRAAPTDPLAVELYLRASHELAKGWRPDIQRAVELYERALALAPGDPTILAGSARARVRLAFYEADDSAPLLERARLAAERAVAAAPDNGEPWAALAAARFMGGDAAGAVRAALGALARAPGLAHAHELIGRILFEVGELDEAAARLRTALAIDPATLTPRFELARLHALLGEWDRADALLALPAPGRSGRIATFLWRLRFALWRGTDDPALDDAPELGPEFGAVADPHAFRETIRTRELSDVYRDVLARASREAGSRRRVLFSQLHAELLAYVFEVDAALDAARDAVDAGLLDRTWMEQCPVLAPLRGEARFAPLRAQLDVRAARVVAALRGG